MHQFPGPKAPKTPRYLQRHGRGLVDPGDFSALDMLALIHDLRADLSKYEEACVATARKGGATWTEIGGLLGMARQNVQRKYAHVEEARTTEGRARR
ncbi:MAG: hypothetical protein H0U79_03750 [Solirubrobacterales bacterium]|nr:hypothetical protein [Solirubrobacterales bacterium]